MEDRTAAAVAALARLQEQVQDREPDEDLAFSEQDGQFRVEYYGRVWDSSLEPVFETLCQPEVADSIETLSFDGPDVGANGTREWDFTPIFRQDITFPRLRSLHIARIAPGHYNRTIVGHILEECGQAARWLDRAPNLEDFTTPSAPDPVFFLRPPHPLRRLRVDAGYETHDFIRHLTGSKCFQRLEELDWGDYREINMDGWEKKTTLPYYYRSLFDSPAAPLPPTVTLRHVIFSEQDEEELRALMQRRHPHGSLTIIRATS